MARTVADMLLAPCHAPWAHPKCKDPREDFQLACQSTALPLNLLDSHLLPHRRICPKPLGQPHLFPSQHLGGSA